MKKTHTIAPIDGDDQTIVSIPIYLPENLSDNSNEFELDLFNDQMKKASILGHEMLNEVRGIAVEHGISSDDLLELVSFRTIENQLIISLKYKLNQVQIDCFSDGEDELISSVNSMMSETSRLLEESAKKSSEGLMHRITVGDKTNLDKGESNLNNSVVSNDPRAVRLATIVISKKFPRTDESHIIILKKDGSEIKLVSGQDTYISVDKKNDPILFSGKVGSVDEFSLYTRVKPDSNSINISRKPIKINISPEQISDLLEMQRKKCSVEFSCKQLTTTNCSRTSKTFELVESKVL